MAESTECPTLTSPKYSPKSWPTPNVFNGKPDTERIGEFEQCFRELIHGFEMCQIKCGLILAYFFLDAETRNPPNILKILDNILPDIIGKLIELVTSVEEAYQNQDLSSIDMRYDCLIRIEIIKLANNVLQKTFSTMAKKNNDSRVAYYLGSEKVQSLLIRQHQMFRLLQLKDLECPTNMDVFKVLEYSSRNSRWLLESFLRAEDFKYLRKVKLVDYDTMKLKDERVAKIKMVKERRRLETDVIRFIGEIYQIVVQQLDQLLEVSGEYIFKDQVRAS